LAELRDASISFWKEVAVDERRQPLLRHVEMAGDQRVGVDQLVDIVQPGPEHDVAAGKRAEIETNVGQATGGRLLRRL
jgi:hypothetical protein